MRNFLFGILALVWAAGATSALAAEWTPADDARLRSDIEILANAGLVDGILTQWPLPWAGLLGRLQADSLTNQPAYVVAAAQRVLARGKAETAPGSHARVTLDATNDPSFVRGFDATGRQKIQTQLSGEMALSSSTLLHLAVGVQAGNPYKPPPPPATVPKFDKAGYVLGGYFLDDRPDHQTLVFDGSYLAQNIGGAVLYAGYLPHWWGPGWMSSMMMSTNARPFPQIGVSRRSTTAFTWPILRWLGPWQAEFLVGVLDGPGTTHNILTDSLRFGFNPAPGLELGVSRTQLFCGTGHPCQPINTFFKLTHNSIHPDNANSSGEIDVRYGNSIAGIPFSVYIQDMFMEAGLPRLQDNSNVFGTTFWIPRGDRTLRLTAEYSNSVPTTLPFAFGNYEHGFAYNTPKYLEGYRYRGRSLGFSLDSDSTLFTLQASIDDAHDRTYTLSWDRAVISNSCNAPGCAFNGVYGNVVTTLPVTINMAEGKVSLPFHNMKLDLSVRIQDDQPRPAHGWTGGLEIEITRQL